MESQVFEKLKEGLRTFLEWINKVKKEGRLDEWARETARVILQAFKVIAKGIEALVGGIIFMKGVFYAALKAMTDKFIKWITNLITAIEILAATFTQLGKVLPPLYKTLSALVAMSTKYAKEADEQFEKATDIVNAFEKLEKVLNDAIKATSKSTKESKEHAKAIGGQSRAVDGLAKSIKRAWEVAIPEFRDVSNALERVGWEAQKAGREIYDAMYKMSIPAARDMTRVLGALADESEFVTKKIGAAWGQVSDEIEAVWIRGLTAAVTEAKNAAEAIENIFKNMQKILLDVVFKNIIDGFKAMFKEGEKAAASFATSIEAIFLVLAVTVTKKLLGKQFEIIGGILKQIFGGEPYSGDILRGEQLSRRRGPGEGEDPTVVRKQSAIMEEYLKRLNKIPAALLTIIKNTGKLSKNLRGLGKIGGLTFRALIAQGMTYIEALNTMRGPLEALFKKYENAGRAIPKFLQPLADMMEKMELKPRIFENLDAALTILDSLKETAYLTEGAFNTLGRSVKQFARGLLDVSGNLVDVMKNTKLTNAQIQALLPAITQFVSAAAAFGLPVPRWMKAYVTEQLGVDWKEFKKSVTDPAIETNKWLGKIFDKTKTSVGLLKDIKKALVNTPHGQYGLDFYSGSRSGLVRYHRDEQVTIQPRMHFSPQFQTVVIEKNDKYIVNVVQQNLNRLNIRVPTQTLVTR